MALSGPNEASPEAAGIFRISPPQADPISLDMTESSDADSAEPVPLPRRRPAASAALSEGETLTLAASSR